jgi:hypothetical protein
VRAESEFWRKETADSVISRTHEARQIGKRFSKKSEFACSDKVCLF